MFPEGQGAFVGAAAPRVGMPRGRGGRREQQQGMKAPKKTPLHCMYSMLNLLDSTCGMHHAGGSHRACQDNGAREVYRSTVLGCACLIRRAERAQRVRAALCEEGGGGPRRATCESAAVRAEPSQLLAGAALTLHQQTTLETCHRCCFDSVAPGQVGRCRQWACVSDTLTLGHTMNLCLKVRECFNHAGVRTGRALSCNCTA